MILYHGTTISGLSMILSKSHNKSPIFTLSNDNYIYFWVKYKKALNNGYISSIINKTYDNIVIIEYIENDINNIEQDLNADHTLDSKKILINKLDVNKINKVYFEKINMKTYKEIYTNIKNNEYLLGGKF